MSYAIEVKVRELNARVKELEARMGTLESKLPRPAILTAPKDEFERAQRKWKTANSLL